MIKKGKRITVEKETDENTREYPSASVLVEVVLNQYGNELSRGSSIDDKANIFIGAVIAALTIFLPSIPYSGIKEYLLDHKECNCGIVGLLIVLIISLILIVFAFVYLYKTVRVRGYSTPKISSITSEEALENNENNTQAALVKHYKKVIEDLEKINSDKADSLELGIKLAVISFLLMLIATVCINFIVL